MTYPAIRNVFWCCVAAVIASETGCRSNLPPPMRAWQVSEQCSDPTGAVFYFPAGIVSENVSIDTANRDALFELLRAIQAPSLSCGDQVNEAYRLVRLLQAQASIVYIVRSEENLMLTAYELSRPPTGWQVSQTVTKQLATADHLRLLGLLEAGDFWTTERWLDSFAAGGRTSASANPLDGLWVIEGRLGRAFRVVTRHTPAQQGFQALGLAFFELAGLDPMDY